MTSGPPPVPGGRTPEEREAARKAREARRASQVDGSVPSRDWIGEARKFVADSSGRVERPQLRRRRLVAAAGVLLAALLVLWFLGSLFQPFKGDGEGKVNVAISKGAGVGDIADLLERRGVVSSSFFFSLRAHLSGRGGDLKPGSYTLKRGMSYGAALDVLAKGPPANIVTLTVPEGRSRREVARIVGGSLDGSYLSASRRSAALNPRRYGAKHATSLEGFLFPATYTLKRGRPVKLLVDQQLAAFRQRFAGVSMRYARSKKLTPYDVLTIASMVEREAAGREGPSADRVGHLQPAAPGHASPDRRDDPLRREQLDAAAHPVAAPDRLAVQHVYAWRASTGADRQPGHRLDQGPPRIPSGPGSSTTWSSPVPAARMRSRRPTPSSSATRPATTASGQSAAAGRPSTVDRARGRRRPAGGPQPLAGDDGGGLRRARPRLALLPPARCRRSCSPRPCARSRAPATRAPT